MFSGIVEAIGRVVQVHPRRGSTRVGVATPPLSRPLRAGESIAVDGVCLTIAAQAGRRFFADVIAETLSRTTLGTLVPGDPVHLEMPLRIGDPLGGHLVQGHVDATARIREVIRKGDDFRLRLDLPTALLPYVAEKGSIALQGVSLTVARVLPKTLEVALIPETRSRTTLGRARAGDRLNVEVDLLARYLESLSASRRRGGRGGGT